MAVTVTTTTNNLRYTMGLKNGDTRYIDIENPITDTAVINANVSALNTKIKNGGAYNGVLVGADYFTGDSDAVVTQINKTEIIQITKTTTTDTVFNG